MLQDGGAVARPVRESRGRSRRWAGPSILVAIAVLLGSTRAEAIPAFARKYGTACQTCHVIYPKLTPFGEAFRRNGFRFPGIDQDYVKLEQVPLGQEASAKSFPHNVWPSFLPGGVPLAFGLNGSVVLHPDKHSGAGEADNQSIFTTQDLVGEAHLWAGGSFTERITFFAELTFGSDGTIDVELGSVHFNDLFHLKHALNLQAGRFRSNLTSFGAHSTYLADTLVPPLSVTGMFGATSDSWNLLNPFNGVELNGTIVGRAYYAIGINAGTNVDVRPTENAYGHVGVRIGGMRLDGEPGGAEPNAQRPWEQTAFNIDGFFYRSTSHYLDANNVAQDDAVLAYGGSLRLQIKSFELNSGAYQERHNGPTGDGMTSVSGLSQWNEVSYVVYPWLVPALRVEYVRLDISGGAGTPWDLKIIPGLAALVVQNLKLVLTCQVEMARGAPVGGWQPSGGFAAPMPGVFTGEIETIGLTMAYAY